MSERLAPLIAQHESWISLDPVQGCPARCVYCYLGPLGLFKKVPKELEYNPEVIYQKLQEYQFFQKSRIANVPADRVFPIAIGNYTDMCLTPKNREYLLSLLHEHERRMPEVPVCVATKAVLERVFLQRVDRIGIKVIFLISLSFFPLDSAIEKGVPSAESRLENFGRISELANIEAIHFWRPLTSINVPDRATAQRQIELVQRVEAAASVITGLKFGDSLAKTFKANIHHPLHGYFNANVEHSRLKNEIFKPEIREAILTVARERSYPVFLHTSCALSYVLGQPDYNATFRKLHLETKCLPSNCPSTQRKRCFDFRCDFESPPRILLDQAAQYLDLPSTSVTYSEELDAILVGRALTQEEQTFLTQATSFPVRGEALVPTLEWVGSINR
jgi:DNA repair photolyase